MTSRGELLLYVREALCDFGHIHLGGDDNLGHAGELGIETSQFMIDRQEIGPGRTVVFGRVQIEQMYEQARALNMLEELVPETFAQMRIRYETRNVSNHAGGVIMQCHHA